MATAFPISIATIRSNIWWNRTNCLRKLLLAGIVCTVGGLSGCQRGMGLNGASPLSMQNPSKVPAPPTGSFKVPGAYYPNTANGAGGNVSQTSLAETTPTASLASNSTTPSVSNFPTSPISARTTTWQSVGDQGVTTASAVFPAGGTTLTPKQGVSSADYSETGSGRTAVIQAGTVNSSSNDSNGLRLQPLASSDLTNLSLEDAAAVRSAALEGSANTQSVGDQPAFNPPRTFVANSFGGPTASSAGSPSSTNQAPSGTTNINDLKWRAPN